MTNTINNLPRELKPCPFCGGDAETDTHTEECYFTVSKDMRAKVAHNADMSLVSAVLRAWNQRAPSPAGVDGLELEARIVWLECESQVSAAPVSEAKAQGVTDEQAAFEAAVAAVNERGWSTSTDLARQIWDAARIDVADCPPSYRGGKE